MLWQTILWIILWVIVGIILLVVFLLGMALVLRLTVDIYLDNNKYKVQMKILCFKVFSHSGKVTKAIDDFSKDDVKLTNIIFEKIKEKFLDEKEDIKCDLNKEKQYNKEKNGNNIEHEHKNDIDYVSEEKKNDESIVSDMKDDILSEKKALQYILDQIKLWIKVLKKIINKFRKSLYIDNLTFGLSIGTSDAARTAIIYGSISTLIYSFAAYINDKLKVKNQEIKVVPNFNNEKINYIFGITASLFVYQILYIIYPAIKSAYKFYKENKKNKEVH